MGATLGLPIASIVGSVMGISGGEIGCFHNQTVREEGPGLCVYVKSA